MIWTKLGISVGTKRQSLAKRKFMAETGNIKEAITAV